MTAARRARRSHRPRRANSASAPSRAASVLLLVLVVIVLMTLASFTFSDLMINENRGTHMFGQQLQSRMVAESGVDFLIQYFAQDPVVRYQDGGEYNNPLRFQGMLVVDGSQPSDRARLSILAPAMDYGIVGTGVRYGLEDESTRINLNVLLAWDRQQEGLGREVLMYLPGMTEDVADAILDWIDEDEQPREFGAESTYYSGLLPPYNAKNAPPETIEELLLVRGVTPALLFGPDMNRNYMIDVDEQNLMAMMPSDDLSGSLVRGWGGFFTLHSAESTLRPDGTPKIDVNGDDLEALHNELLTVLDEDMANFIILYRQNGAAEDEPQDARRQSASSVDLNLEQQGGTQINSLLDLIGVSVQQGGEEAGGGGGGGGDDDEDDEEEEGGGGRGGRGGGGGGGGGGGQQNQQAVVIESPFGEEANELEAYLPQLMDNLTVGSNPSVPGRININQASEAVLRCIPEITEEIVQQILSRRQLEASPDDPTRRHPTWLLSEALVSVEEMKALHPYINAGGNVYRGQIVGFYEQNGPATRLEVLIDATQLPGRLLFWRDISHLGRGYDQAVLGGLVDTLQ
ncbi:MAG: hypothetical protein WDZ59_07275 [Pirellulales bacterium]